MQPKHEFNLQCLASADLLKYLCGASDQALTKVREREAALLLRRMRFNLLI